MRVLLLHAAPGPEAHERGQSADCLKSAAQAEEADAKEPQKVLERLEKAALEGKEGRLDNSSGMHATSSWVRGRHKALQICRGREPPSDTLEPTTSCR
jgi:hypothetical protein